MGVLDSGQRALAADRGFLKPSETPEEERDVQTLVAPTGKAVSLKLPDAGSDDGGRRPRATR